MIKLYRRRKQRKEEPVWKRDDFWGFEDPYLIEQASEERHIYLANPVFLS